MQKNTVVFRKDAYFRYCEEFNTETTLKLAKERCLELGLSKIVIASETGRSVLNALDIIKDTNIQLIVVTHYPATTWRPKEDIPIGLARKEYSETRKKLIREYMI